jgi:hypothetical protein
MEKGVGYGVGHNNGEACFEKMPNEQLPLTLGSQWYPVNVRCRQKGCTKWSGQPTFIFIIDCSSPERAAGLSYGSVEKSRQHFPVLVVENCSCITRFFLDLLTISQPETVMI